MSLIRNRENNPAELGVVTQAGLFLTLCWNMLAHK